MDAEDFLAQLSFVQNRAGVTLTLNEKAALQSSLLQLKRNGRFARVVFWGKIFGVAADYLIAQGIQSTLTDFKRKSFYSHDGVTWAQLPDVDAESSALCAQITGRYQGDPSHEYKVARPVHEDEKVDEPQAAVEKTPDDDGEKNPDEEEEEGEGADIKDAVVIKEEKRLSAAIAQIDNDAAIAPRGAYVLTASHDINVNRAFSGLAASSAEQLQNYFHLRVPKTIKEKTLLDFELEGLVKSIDFLDNISEDLPKGLLLHIINLLLFVQLFDHQLPTTLYLLIHKSCGVQP
eukprot:TRINITY_DN694_c0_g1_i7.p1 TRINITY_DN694_c0_g1~~TRINITY_DN694_c0_g1_i7.p1  ORF type:complete len:290 (-),score=71.11 TRINITY_DN694_c0_g1_i7:1034-1903(-)